MQSSTKNRSTPEAADSSEIVPLLEHNAVKASYEAYIASIKGGHERMIQNLRSKHAEEVSALKNQLATDVTATKADLANERQTQAATQEAAILEASRKMAEESAELVQGLRDKISSLEDDTQVLQDGYKNALDRERTNAEAAQQQVVRLQGQVATLKKAHGNELRRMEEKLAVGPNSWVKLCFRGKGRTKPREHFYRYTATLREATRQMLRDLGHRAEEKYVFRRESLKGATCNLSMTLQEIGIKDGEEIWFEKET